MERKMEGRQKNRTTCIHLPIDMDTTIRLHAARQGTSFGDLYRTVIDRWVETHLGDSKILRDIKKLQAVQLNIKPLEDRRKPAAARGKSERPVTLALTRDSHWRLKQLCIARQMTLRGIVVAIMQEWVDQTL